MSASTLASSNIVLITGANQGLGFAIAKVLSAKPNYHVLVGSRNAQRGIDAAKQLQDEGLSVEPITIDVTSDDSIAAATEQIKSKFGRLDVLINNAGVAPNEETSTFGPELRSSYQNTYAVNVFGSALTTEAFIPLLGASPTPRIVFMSSEMGSLHDRPKYPVILPLYRSSKSALNMIMLHYSIMFKEQGWKINANCPGYCATNLNHFAGIRTVEEGAVNAVRLATLGKDGETGTYSNKEGPLPW